jgi:hypothetical protein
MLASGSLLIAARAKGVPAILRDVEAARIPISVVGRLTDDPGDTSLIVGGERQPLPEFAIDEVARVLSGSANSDSSPSAPAS